MRIAVDCDDTLCDFHTLYAQLLTWKTGTLYDPNSFTKWTSVQDNGNEKAFWGFLDLLETSHLRRAMAPVDILACPSIKWLVRRGHDVHILTANRDAARESITSWLFMHGLELPLDMIGRKNPHEKAALDFDFFIDDAPGLAVEMGEQPSKRLFLVPQPWNRQVIPTRNVITSFSWRRAIDHFEAHDL